MLYEPNTSISITDLKALTESWLIDARKFPAAPALYDCQQVVTTVTNLPREDCVHDKINATQLLHATIDSSLDTIETAHIRRANTDDFRTRSRSRDTDRHLFGFFDVAADNACVGAEVDECADLGAAYCASTTGAEDYFIL